MVAQQDVSRPAEMHDPYRVHHRVPGWGIFLIVLFVIIVIAFVAWFIFSRLRRRQLGPSTRNYPARGGVIGWLQSKIRSRGYRRAGGLGRKSRTAAGGNLDDDVWNTRLGNEADDFGHSRYDEGVGLHSNVQPYSAGGYGHVEHGYGPQSGLNEISRGKDGQQELDDRYDDEMRGRNPFDERQGAERSDYTGGYRSVSSAPHEDQHHHAGDSPTERRSMFKEAV